MSTPPPDLDLTRVPRGEVAAAQLVAAAAARGDFSEHHYLELKGPPDLTSKTNKAKLAKFILGAANRLPERAAEAFEGYGVMIIGITDNRVEGVPPIDTLELSQVIQPLLGADGPRWDIVRVPVEQSSNQVIVLLVDPPQTGQKPFICRSNGEGLQNGRIYFRGDGETREAMADELDLLFARGSAQLPAPVELEISIVGTVVPLIVDEDRTLNEFISKTRGQLLEALAGPPPAAPSQPETAGVAPSAARLRGIEEPEKRSEEQYKDEIEAWAAEFRAAWPESLEAFAAHLIPANEVSVLNKTLTFLHDVEINLHIDGAVEALERGWHMDELSLRAVGLPNPPRKWGPTNRSLDLVYGYPGNFAGPIGVPGLHTSRSPLPPDASWWTTGSVDVGVTVGDLRPEGRFQTNDGDSILIIGSQTPEPIRGTWTATARGFNEVFKGDLTATLAEPTDLTQLVRAALGLR